MTEWVEWVSDFHSLPSIEGLDHMTYLEKVNVFSYVPKGKNFGWYAARVALLYM